jgi:hypothetical protein
LLQVTVRYRDLDQIVQRAFSLWVIRGRAHAASETLHHVVAELLLLRIKQCGRQFPDARIATLLRGDGEKR